MLKFVCAQLLWCCVQSVLNAAARLICRLGFREHINIIDAFVSSSASSTAYELQNAKFVVYKMPVLTYKFCTTSHHDIGHSCVASKYRGAGAPGTEYEANLLIAQFKSFVSRC